MRPVTLRSELKYRYTPLIHSLKKELRKPALNYWLSVKNLLQMHRRHNNFKHQNFNENNSASYIDIVG